MEERATSALRAVSTRRSTRREFVRLGMAAALGLPAAASALASGILGCGGPGDGEAEEPAATGDAGRAPGGEGTQAGEGMQAREGESAPAASEPPASSPAEAASDAELVTEVPAMASLVSTLQYVHESPKSGQVCSNCQFYTAQSEGLGKCQLFAQGLVRAEGWCTRWTARM